MDFLTGKEFSSNLKFIYSQKEKMIPSRIDYLVNIAANKKIIHLGCVDHIDLIQEKIKKNVWLHKRLSDVATRCLGIDLNKKGIDLIQNNYGFKDVICCNILDYNKEITDNFWDYIIMGEVIEHIEDPILFLKEIKKKYFNKIKKIVITVPNGFRYRNFKNIYKNLENINSDHKFWFTPFTISKIISLSGMKLKNLILCENYGYSRRYFINYLRLKYYPLFRDTIIAEAEI